MYIAKPKKFYVPSGVIDEDDTIGEEKATVKSDVTPVTPKTVVPTNTAVIPGSVIFLNSTACSGAFAHLRQRPLIVLRVMTGVPVSQVLCVETGSSGNLPGIVIHLQSRYGWIGGKPTSYCYPWSFVSVSPRDIREVVTYIRADVLEVINKAVKYHMGYSDEVPPYMEEMSYDIEYFRPVYPLKPSQKSNYEDEPDLPPPPTQIDKAAPPDEIGPGSNDDEESDDEPATPVKERKLGPKLAEVVANLTESEMATFISRSSTNVELATQYHISAADASRIRSFLEDERITVSTLKDIFRKTRNMRLAKSTLTLTEHVIMAVYMDHRMLKMNEKEFIMMRDSTFRAFNIDLTAKTWNYRRAAMAKLRHEWDIILPTLK